MRLGIRFVRLAIPVALFVLSVGISSASTISYEQAIALQAVSWGPTSLSLSQFNPALGTLVGVELELDSTALATLRVRNPYTYVGNFYSAIAEIDLTLTGPASLTFTSHSQTAPQSGTVPALTRVTMSGLPASGSASMVIAPANFAAYIGIGTIGSMQATGGNATAGGAGTPGLIYSALGSVGGTARVIYTYTANIPEPAAMILIGSGLFGFGFLARRRRVRTA